MDARISPCGLKAESSLHQIVSGLRPQTKGAAASLADLDAEDAAPLLHPHNRKPKHTAHVQRALAGSEFDHPPPAPVASLPSGRAPNGTSLSDALGGEDRDTWPSDEEKDTTAKKTLSPAPLY